MRQSLFLIAKHTSMLPWGQEGVPDSLCNIQDTVCVEPQPHISNFTEEYHHKTTNAVLDPKTGVSISYDVVNLVPIA